jgi:adenosylmethionine-8-amino-7-oxononanoate aminotransferase
VPPAPGYFKRIREICDQHGVLFIADEVMCGMGRTGTLFAIEQEGVCPDLITIAKGLGAGYQPIAAVMARESVVAAIEAGSGALANGHTYMSHPVACAASLAVLDVIEGEDLMPRVRAQGEALRDALQARFGQHPNVGDIRGRGLFLALELVADRDSRAPFPRARRVAERLKVVAQGEGLICYPSSGGADGEEGDHVVLAPAYLIGPEHVAEIVDKLDRALAITLAADC